MKFSTEKKLFSHTRVSGWQSMGAARAQTLRAKRESRRGKVHGSSTHNNNDLWQCSTRAGDLNWVECAWMHRHLVLINIPENDFFLLYCVKEKTLSLLRWVKTFPFDFTGWFLCFPVKERMESQTWVVAFSPPPSNSFLRAPHSACAVQVLRLNIFLSYLTVLEEWTG